MMGMVKNSGAALRFDALLDALDAEIAAVKRHVEATDSLLRELRRRNVGNCPWTGQSVLWNDRTAIVKSVSDDGNRVRLLLEDGALVSVPVNQVQDAHAPQGHRAQGVQHEPPR
jgi:hypothetical protein